MWKEVLGGDSPTYPVCHLALTSSTTSTAAGWAAGSCWKGAPSTKMQTLVGVINARKKALSKGRTNILGRNHVLLLTLNAVSMQSEILCRYLHLLLVFISSFCTSVSDLSHQFYFCCLSFFLPRILEVLAFSFFQNDASGTWFHNYSVFFNACSWKKTPTFSCISVTLLLSFRSTKTGRWFWRKKKASYFCICHSAANLSRLPELF